MRLSLLLAGALALLTGCSAPAVILKAHAPAKISYRVTRTAEDPTPKRGEYTLLGDVDEQKPFEWVLPPELYGAHISFKARFERAETEQQVVVKIRDEDSPDQVISFSTPGGLP